MKLKQDNDSIYSKKLNRVLATVVLEKHPTTPYYYTGEIKENNVPEHLVKMIKKYTQAVNEMTFSVLDRIEYQIQEYEIVLLDNDIPIYQLGLDIKSIGRISFFTKYPTGQGYLDEYPKILK